VPPPGYEPFLRAICANPEDDTVRLVYADWLDENGDAERAEFIRLQIQGARGEIAITPDALRSRKLFDTNAAKWIAELPKLSGINFSWFHRGFAAQISTSDVRWLIRHHVEAFGATPVQVLLLSDCGEGKLSRVLTLPVLAQIESLTIGNCRVTAGGWGGLISCPHLGRLRRLVIGSGGPHHLGRIGGPGWILSDQEAEALAASPRFPRLESVELFGAVPVRAMEILRTRFKRFRCVS
jgi:uncharacterized protein (TIGR02996 family)